jgi:hypothetical protein
MNLSQVHYLPLAPPFFLILVGLFVILLVLIQLGALRYAYMRLGISSGAALFLLFASLIGSYFNIPVVYLPEQRVLAQQEIDFFGMRYVVPFVAQWPGTLIAVNVGGAVIPTMMSLYLLAKNRLWVKAALATAAVAAVCYWLSRPIPDGDRCIVALARAGGAARLYRGQPGRADRGGSAQSRQHPRAGRSGGFDRRSWNLRRHFPDRNCRGVDRQLLTVMDIGRAAILGASSAESRWARSGWLCQRQVCIARLSAR